MRYVKHLQVIVQRSLMGALVLFAGDRAVAQLTVAAQSDLQQLASTITGTGVQISNPVITCHALGYGEYSYSGTGMDLTQGVILTSGRITDAIGPNNSTGSGTWFAQNTPGDPLLDAVTGRTTRDACKFEFDIIPTGDSLRFDFTFASEEYNEWVGSQYNDVFGFFISGPGIVGDPGAGGAHNIALVPGTVTPVTINNVNNGSNAAYYHDNTGGLVTQYDGYTQDIAAFAVVQACQSYHLKLIIADATDRKFDSGVFIEKIQSPTITMSSFTASGSPDMVEGCNAGWVRFDRGSPRPTPLTLQYYLQGTATNGTDYAAINPVNPALPKLITIPAGQSHVDRAVTPFSDVIAEPTENLKFILGNPNCPGQNLDSLIFNIVDTLIATVAPLNPTICNGGSVQFQVTGGAGYAWSPAAGLSCTNCPNPVASPSSTTTYTVVITDGTCSRTVNRQVRVSNLSLSAVVTHPLCAGSTNGAINLNISNGYAPYAYSWTGPGGFTAATQDISNLAPGTYTVTVTDAACTRTASYNVIAPAVLSVSLAPAILPFGQNISCHGGNDGSIDATITGGTGPYSVSWNGPGGYSSSNIDLSNLGAGTYTITVTDNNGCTASTNTTLIETTQLVASITGITPVVCFGDALGSATVSASGGVPPYSYSWNSSPVQSTPTASALAVGSYTVTVTDGYGCVATTTAAIAGPTAPLTTTLTSQTNVLCHGNSTGDATINVSGGTAPYTTTWNTAPPQTGTSATNLPAGTWIATVTDANGCGTTRSVTITEPASSISASIFSQTDVLCFGNSTGSATVSASGGTGPYTYSWNTTPTQNTATANNLSAGSHTCTVRDVNLCSVLVSVTITQPVSALSAGITAQTNVLCFGNSTGSATVSVSGGTAPYSYSWNSSPAQSTATASNLAAGTYTCTITDANGCSTSANVTITQPLASLNASISAQTNVLCFGNSTGSATVSVSGGTAPYAYSWNSSPAQSTATASNLVAGSYTCTITDANGCSTSASVTITQPAAILSASISPQTNVLCFGNATGSATVNVSGGTGPYGYSWNTSPAQSTSTASNLLAGSYTCTITDASGCSTSANVTITQPLASLSASISAQTDVLCFGNTTGSATVSASGGTGPYSYSWNTGPVQTNATAVALTAGSFTCTITDANGCSTSANVTITQPLASLSASISAQTNVLCFGNATGSATVNVSGGTGSYTYSWNTVPVQTSATAMALTAGSYTCTITDANGCSTSAGITIAQPAVALAISGAVTPASCGGSATGAVNAVVNGGTLPYSHSWTGPGGFSASTEDISALVSGVYDLVVTDANGCTAAQSFSVGQPGFFSISGTTSSYNGGVEVSCAGATDGSIGQTISGGTMPYTLAWTGPGGFTSSAEDINGLAAGTYVFVLTDANGCNTSATYILDGPAPLGLSASASIVVGGYHIACNGSSTGGIDGTISGGVGPYVIAWSGPGGFNSSTIDISGLQAGNYTLDVTDANGCNASISILLTEPAALAASIATQNNVNCFGSSTGSASANASGGTAPLSYSWNTVPVQTGPSASGLGAGTYTCTITDANGCGTSINATITEPIAALNAVITSQSNVLIFGQSTGSATVTANDGTGPYTYLWSNGQTSATAINLAAGTYSVTVTDANGCTLTVGVTITQPGSALSASVSAQTNVLCSGDATGEATVTVTGGTPAYSYGWNTSPVQTGAMATGLTAGTWTCTVTDANGAMTTANVTITQPLVPLSASIGSQSDVDCFGNATGNATANASGGTPLYSYGWNTVPVQNTATAVNLSAGTYTCTIVDASGCTTSQNVTIAQPAAPLAASISALSDVDCFGNATGSASTNVTGGSAPYTYSWNTSPPQTTSTASGLAAGNWICTIADANGCTTSINAIIAQPSSALGVSISNALQATCGALNGGATAGASGGTAPYSYSWNTVPMQNGAVLNGVAAGTYTVSVTDANACTTSANVTITSPSGLSLSIAGTTAQTCFGTANGQATVVTIGGNAPYSFSWNTVPAQTSATASGLIAGSYSATVTDADGCSASISVTVNGPSAPLTLSATSTTDVLCHGDDSGSATVTAAGGQAPYSVTWNTVPPQIGLTATDLTAGTYTATAVDALGCSTSVNVTISEPATDLNAYVESYGNESCYGANDGWATIEASGGSGSWSIVWNTVPPQYGATATGLAPGPYMVSITDNNGCATPKQFPVVITGPASPLTISTVLSDFNGYNISCPGASDGTIDLTISGGTAPYNQQWSDIYGGVTGIEDLSGQTAGICDLLVTDAHGCTVTASIMLTEPPAMTATANITTVACQGTANGALDVTIAGGISPYTFNWSGPSAFSASTEDISGLNAGVYTLDVSDANGCANTFTFDVNEPGLFNLSAIISSYPGGNNVSCATSNDGSIDVTATGGTGPYAFLWSGPGGFTANTEDISGLAAGTYDLTLTDANGCGTLGEYTLTAPGTLIAGLAAQIYPSGANTSCIGANDGVIDATITGGTPGFVIAWSGPAGFSASTEDISGLAPGTYTITVWDVNGCTDAHSVILSSATAISASINVSQYNSGDAVSCNGSSTGIIDISISGGVAPYSVNWSGPGGYASTDADISGLAAGTYTAVVSDAAGCDTTLSVTLTEPTPVVVAGSTSMINGYEVGCDGAGSGSIDLSVSGGAGNYTFQWNGPNAFVSTNEDINGLEAGIYDVTVTDMNGCSSVISFTLNAPPPITASSAITTAACQGSNTGAIDLTITGGVAPFAVQWIGPGGFNASTEDLSGLFAGIYDVTITDQNGCTHAQSFDVNQPGQFTISASTSVYPGGYGVGCSGASDGAIDVTATGGTSPLFYAWSGPGGFSAITEDISGLAPGTYDLTITDANGCSALTGWTLVAPTPIDLGLVATQYAGGANVGCSGSADGSIDAVLIGGVTPYAIQWNGPNGFVSISEDIAGLEAGTYTINVVDAVGCTASDSVTLSEPVPIDIQVLVSTYAGGGNLSCDGESDGSIDLDLTGGSLLYFINWSGPNGFVSNDEDISGLEAGTYNVSVTDANGCTSAASITLTGPAPIMIDLAVSQYSGGYAIGCSGDSTGAIDATVQGGAIPWTYSWTGPGGFTSTDQDLNGVPAGDYTLVVTDATGCSASATVTLTEPSVIGGSAILSDAGNGYEIGCGGNDGSIDVSVMGGNPPYIFDWTGTGGFASLSEDLNGLVAGTYDLTVTDANGCSISMSYTLDQAGSLSALVAVSGNVCDGLDDGAIDLTVLGGVAPFNFSWTGPGGFTSTNEDLDSLAGGVYAVDISDAGGCTTQQTATIAASSPIDITLFTSYYNGLNIPCAGDSSGVIGVTITGGAAPIDFAWSGPGGFSSSDTYLTGLVAGDYTISINDLNGCGLDSTITLTGPAVALSGSVAAAVFPSGTNISCFGAFDGSIDATAIGGSAPYSFDWRGPDSTSFSTEDITGLAAGTYDLVITDANSCTYTTSITLTQPDSAITASVTLSQFNGFNTSCLGTSDGWIDVTVGGGSGGFTYQWSGPGGFGASTADISNVPAGSYALLITDENGCTLTIPVEVTGPLPIATTLSPFTFPGGTNISCAGANDGSITSSIGGGAPGYALLWNGPGGFTSNNPDISGLAPGTYCLSVTDVNGCTQQTCTDIVEPAPLVLDATSNSASCGSDDGTVDLTITGGTMPYLIEWSNGASTEDLFDLEAGSYSVQVFDANGCSQSMTVVVNGSTGVVAVAAVTNEICAGNNDGAIDITITSGAPPFTFEWSNGADTEDINGIPPGGYSVTITDANGCTWTGNYSVVAGASITIQPTVFVYGNGYNVSGYGASDGSITVNVDGGSAPYDYDWSNGATGAIIGGLAAGSYTVTVTDANGCRATLTLTILEPNDIQLPTGFSPNGDGQNDAYVVHGLDAFPDNKLVVFNRWGNVVFEQLNYRNDWTGTNLQNEPLPNGTYFVILELGSGSGVERPAIDLQNFIDLRR